MPSCPTPEELRHRSTVLLRHSHALRRDAEEARRKGAECREVARRQWASAQHRRASAEAAQRRQNDRVTRRLQRPFRNKSDQGEFYQPCHYSVITVVSTRLSQHGRCMVEPMENTVTWLKLAAHARAIANDMRDSRNEQTMREIASRYELLAARSNNHERGEKEP